MRGVTKHTIDIDAPGQISRSPDEFLIEKITDSAENITDRDSQAYDVEKRIDRTRMFAPKEIGGDQCA